MRQVMVRLVGHSYGFTYGHIGKIFKANCVGIPRGKGSTHYQADYRDLIAVGMTDAYAVGGTPETPFVGERDFDPYDIQDATYYCEVDDYTGVNGGPNLKSKAERKQARWAKRKAIARARRSDWVIEPIFDNGHE